MRNTDINRFVEPRATRPSGGGSAGGTAWLVTRKFFGFIVKTLFAVILVGMVTGIIVGTSLFLYVMTLAGTEADINLNAVKLNQTSFVYTTDAKGNTKEQVRLHGTENRVWVDLDSIPENMKKAVIAIEDERFEEHKGVDWQRTLAAGLNLFSGDKMFGASTITQQLIKNRTGDDDVSLNRKLTEIFKALNLEKKFSKPEILESYLNVIALGNGCNGVQAAANTYFDKDVKDLTLAECACIAGITQNPSKFNPLRNPENNKARQEIVLNMMANNEFITVEEARAAKAEKLNFKQKEKTEVAVPVWDYYVDLIIEDVIADMISEKDMSRQAAIDSVYNGGLRIYSAVDHKMQGILEDIFYNNDKCLPNNKSLQCATLVVNYEGRVLGTIGGRGKKPSNRCLNRSTQSKRQPGSSIKPIGAYAPAIEYDFASWSKVFPDEMIQLKEGGKVINWPKNSNRTYHPAMTVQKAIQISSNCVAARVVQLMGPRTCFDFLTQKLGFTSLVESRTDEKTGKALSNDLTLAAYGTGGMTFGVTIREMSAGYAVFGNGGKFYKPYSYTKIMDYENKVTVIDHTDDEPIQAISQGNATVMNKLLQKVTQSGGTAPGAGFGSWTVFGKTGTTNDNKDRWFVGGTPICVAAVWSGYDMPASMGKMSNPCIPVWREIMKRYHDGVKKKDFDLKGATTKRYCTVTGGAAQSYCYSTQVGWYERGFSLKKCNGDHSLDTDAHGSGSGSSGSSSVSSGASSGASSHTSGGVSSDSKSSGGKSSAPVTSKPPTPSSKPPAPSSKPPSSSSSKQPSSGSSSSEESAVTTP